jgi:hypothetical protein
MQKKLLPMMLLFVSSAAIAQPTITNTSNPQHGNSFTYYTCDSVGPGAAGANVNWNFTNLNSTSNLSMTFRNCPWAECDTFTGSNLTAAPDATNGGYYIATSNKFAWNGEHVMGGPKFKYTDERDIRRYPFTMGDTYTDTHLSTFASVGYPWQRRGSVTVTADAYGTLQLPNYTHTNVLRLHYVDSMADSALTFSMESNYIRDVYEWWVPGQKEYLLHVELLTLLPSLINPNSMTIPTIIYTNQFPASVNEIANNGDIKIYPVPAHDNVTIEMANGNIQSVEMTDIVGKRVVSVNGVKGQLIYQINTSGIGAGIYLIRINSDNGIMTRKIEVQ